MKITIIIMTAVGVGFLLSLTNCSRSAYYITSPIEKFSTKKEVLASFGAPTQKEIKDGIEEWVYNYDKIPKTDHLRLTPAEHSQKTRLSSPAVSVIRENTLMSENCKTCIIVKFNKLDEVIDWNNNGLIVTAEKNPAVISFFATLGVIAVVGTVLLLIGISHENT